MIGVRKTSTLFLSRRKIGFRRLQEFASTEKIIIDSAFAFEDAKSAFERLNTGMARGKLVVNAR